MAAPPDVAANDTPIVDVVDERLSRRSAWRRFLARPDLGAFAGVVLVFVFFGLTAGGTGMFAADGVLNWLTVTAQLMIIGTGSALLMIGGEFDLSVGSMIGFVGMMIAIPTIYFGVPVGVSVILAFVAAMAGTQVAVVGCAGDVNAGRVDPLAELARIAHRDRRPRLVRDDLEVARDAEAASGAEARRDERERAGDPGRATPEETACGHQNRPVRPALDGLA